MDESKENQLGFTADFSFHKGQPIFTGFSLETLVSATIGAKYRVLVKNPADNLLYTVKGMEEPMTQEEINKVLEQRYRGGIAADEFAFEVFDKDVKPIFKTRFNAKERTPADAYSPDKFVVTSFTWSFELPDYLKLLQQK